MTFIILEDEAYWQEQHFRAISEASDHNRTKHHFGYLSLLLARYSAFRLWPVS
jgi:hypothetical protein